MIIGINASNIKSVGGINHIYNLLINLKKNKYNSEVKKIYVWSSKKAYKQLNKISNKRIIIKEIKFDNIIYNLLWKIIFLNLNLSNYKCDILFSLDGIVLRKYKKTILLYQNLIPFNYQEIVNYGLSFQTVKNIFTFFLYKFSKKNSDGIIFLNKYGENLIEKKIGKVVNKKIIPHGVNRIFFNVKNNTFKSNKIINIIYVSPIDHYKHQWNVIEAVKRFNENNLKYNLHIVGPISNTQSRKNLLKQLDKANLNKKSIYYYGNQSEKEIIKIMKKCQIFLFASSCESFGLTLLEGMASNLAILTSDLSGLKKTTENKAIYFNPWDVNSIYSALIKYDKLSKKQIIKNQKNTTRIASNFNWKVCADQTFFYINKIFKSNKEKINKISNDNIKLNFLSFWKKNIFIFAYSLNFFIPIALFFIFYLFGQKTLSVQYAIILAAASFVTQFLSANLRNIIIADKIKDIIDIIVFRTFVSILIISIGSFLIYSIYNFNLYIIISALSIVTLSWIKEIALTNSEINNKLKPETIFQSLSILVIILTLFIYLYTENTKYLLFLPIYILLELVLRFFVINFNLKNKISLKLSKIFNKSKYSFKISYAFFSGLFLTLLNLLIRIFTENNFEVNYAADFFFCFSLATFPGTIVNSILGVSYLKNEMRFPIYFKILLLTYFLVFIFSFNIKVELFQFNTNLALIVTSLTGLINVTTQSIRQLNIINSVKRNTTFKRDIIFFISSILLLFVFIIYFKKYFIFYILIISFNAFFIYLMYYNPLNIFRTVKW